MEKIKVLLVDDHYLFLKGLESIIEGENSLEVAGEARTGDEAMTMVRSLNPDVILMDVNLAPEGGLETLKLIMEEMPDSRIIMLASDEDEKNLFDAIKFGARGLLQKNLQPNELFSFIQMVCRGEYIFSGPLAKQIINRVALIEECSHEAGKKGNMLTKREKEILVEVTKGMTNRQIASALFISENTVKNHIRNIMEKLQINNRVQAASYAMNEGWLQQV
ncbi:response regulator [Neobacillus notoginsengisoli]|nr:response regulator transcription factor [Neobacillus notoginsengisoli]